MKTRHWNKQNANISMLGYGCMRFPITEDGKINVPEAEKLLEHAYDAGVNYFDTAYPYHNGQSEVFMGNFLKRYPRDSYYLATKMPIFLIRDLAHAKEIFEEQLANLQTDHFDFYLVHAIEKERYELVQREGIIPWLQELKAEGKIKNLGFSFHDTYDLFEEVLTSYPWDFCQIQYNYMDKEHQAGIRGLHLAQSMDIPVITMESIRGGGLATLPDHLTEKLQAVKPGLTPSAWALRWLASQEGVFITLSGMSSMEQVEDNIATYTNFEPMTDEENTLIVEVEKSLRADTHNTCTACQYCQPCPVGVNIPRNFTLWNSYGIFKDKDQSARYWRDLPNEMRANLCVGCGKCETVCPQHIDIRKDLATLQVELDELVADYLK